MASKKKYADKILTPRFKVMWPSVFVAEEQRRGKFGLRAVFDLETDLAKLRDGVFAVLKDSKEFTDKEKVAYKKEVLESWPTPPLTVVRGNLQQPFLDGNETGRDEPWRGFEDSVYLNLYSKFVPGVIDQAKRAILDHEPTEQEASSFPNGYIVAPDKFYSGCYARATVIPNDYPSIEGGKPGINFMLCNLQFLADGERIESRGRAEEDFDAVADASDDDLDGM